MRRSTKGFEYTEGNYYFTIKNNSSNITMHRKDKEMAISTYRHYQGVGKQVIWLGKWDGKNFVEASIS